MKNKFFIAMILLNVLLFQTAFVRMMSFMRVYQSFGHLVELVGSCIQDVRIFTVYLFGWITALSLQYQIVGV